MLNKLVPDYWRGRIILSLLLSFMLGIVIAEYCDPALWLAGALSVAALLFAIVTFKRGGLWIFLPLALTLGLLFCAVDKAEIAAFPDDNGRNIIVCGKIVALTPGEDNWRAQLAVDTIDGESVGCADIYLYGEGTPPGVGSVIEARGTVFTPEPYGNANAFDYHQYLQTQGIAGAVSTQFTGKITVLEPGPAFYPGRIGEWLRHNLDQAAEVLNEQQKALVYGVFLGDKSGLDYQMKNALGLTGSLHAFAVSGLHVGYVVALALLLVGSGYRRRWPRFIVCVVMLIIYISLTGMVPAVLRASIMAVCLLLAGLFDEQDDRLTALAMAALICLCIHPRWLFSAGFQMSFAAAAGIIGLSPFFDKLMYKLPRGIRGFFSVTFGASLATLPLVCYYFYHISWLGWLLSPLVILGAGVTVMLSFIAVVLSVFSPWLGGICLEAAAYAIVPVYQLCEKISYWQATATVTGSVPAWSVVVFMLLLLLLPLLLRKFGKICAGAAVVVMVALFSLLVPRMVAPQYDLQGEVAEVVFLDVGQGDCALIITPDGQTAMIDGGGVMNSPGSVGEYSVLPYLKSRGITHIDLMINSHPHEDHTDGLLSVLDYLEVDQLIWNGVADEEQMSQNLLTAAADNGAEITVAQAGDVCYLGDELSFSFYYPPADFVSEPGDDGNDSSLVCEVSFGATDILFTGDIGGDLLAAVCEDNQIEAEIIKIPHHGSNTGYNTQLAELLCSEAAVICVGEDNSYGHPTAKVVEYWQENGEIYRTDTDGSVIVYTNGSEYQIYTYY